MSNCNYTQLSNEQIVDAICSYKVSKFNLSRFIKNHNFELYQELLNRTCFLDQELRGKVSIFARLYCIQHNLKTVPECSCPGCHNKVSWNGTKFGGHCSNRCINDDPLVKQKIRDVFIEKYGCTSSLQNPEVKRKSDRTCMERYGTTTPMRNAQVQDRYKQTCLKRYGVEWASQDEEVKNRQLASNIQNHGGIGFSSDEIMNKCKQTNLQRYGVEFASKSNEFREKVRETCQRKYGVDCVLQSEEVRETIRRILLTKYGVEHISQVKEIMEKRNQTDIELYGGVGYASDEIRHKCENTCRKKFGTNIYTNSEDFANRYNDIQRKRIKTCILRYGVDHFAKTPGFNSLIHKPYVNDKYPDMSFGSSWEFVVYDFLKEHNIEFEYQPSISLPYQYNDKLHTYHPDFLLKNGRIVEVKGDHFFNECGQMINPYDRSKDNLYEAKHQCMMKNNVIILKHSQIKNLTIEMFA